MSLLVFLIFIFNTKLVFSITCISYSGSTSSSYQAKTNVTGPGNAWCAVKAWAGPFFGVDYKPYNSLTEMCCKGSSFFTGNVQYQISTIGSGNTCCNGLAYDNTTGICCSVYDYKSETYSNNVGLGDTCCGTKPYYENKQACCNYYIPALKLTIYSVADECCKFGQSTVNKTYQVCCNDWQVGNGDSCCNFNGEENGNEPPDVPYYKKEKCCIKGKLNDYACVNGGSSHFFRSFSSILFLYFYVQFVFKIK